MANKKEEKKNVTKKTTTKTTKKTTTKQTNKKPEVKEEVTSEEVIVEEKMSNPKKSTTFTIVVLAAIIICLVALFIPNKGNKNKNTSLELTELTCDNITDNIDNSDNKLNKVSCNGYQSLVSEEQDNLILIARPTCGYCVKYIPVLEEIVDEYGIKINYFDVDTLSDNENKAFYKSSSLFSSNDFGTPTLIVTNNNKIVKYSIGYKEKEATINWLKENGIISE